MLNGPSYQMQELHYWARDQAQSSAEVDYVMQHNMNIIPIEVKAGKTGQLKSLHYFIHDKHSSMAIRFNADIASKEVVQSKVHFQEPFSYELISLPFYMSGQLQRLLKEG